MKTDKKSEYICAACQKAPIQTDGYYHSHKADGGVTICRDCYDAGIVWAAKQALKSK